MDIIYGMMTVALIVVFINTIYAHIYKIVNMPSMPATRKMIIKHIRQSHGDCDELNIYDLGSGWGGLCLNIVRAFPKAKISGFEISPIPFGISVIRRLFLFKTQYNLHYGDIFKQDLSKADVIICYLSNYHMQKMAKKLATDCKKDVLIYSQGFPIETMQPIEVLAITYSIEKTLYIYKITPRHQA